jgi:hypothetical protein
MPVIQDDPVQVKGSIRVQNNLKTSVGPITMSVGTFLDPNKVALATFKIQPVTIPVLGPGATGSADFEKLQGSMFPASGCDTLACGKKFIVDVTLTAPNIGNGGYDAMTVPIDIQCTR